MAKDELQQVACLVDISALSSF